VYLDALERAYPTLPMRQIILKAQAQICLELLRKEPMNSFVPEIIDPQSFEPSRDNWRNFLVAETEYKERFGRFFQDDLEGKELMEGLNLWYKIMGIGKPGSAMRAAVTTWNAVISRLVPPNVPPARYFNIPVRLVKRARRLLRQS
jgi:hypothetical protein